MKKNRLISLIWIIATILEWINIILFFAATGEPRIPFTWYQAILSYGYVDVLFHISAGIALLLFAILVKINQKKENLRDMLIALMCFTAQIFLLIWKIKL